MSADHYVLASTAVRGGYQMSCSCNWVSVVVVDPLDLFDAWAGHVIDAESQLP